MISSLPPIASTKRLDVLTYMSVRCSTFEISGCVAPRQPREDIEGLEDEVAAPDQSGLSMLPMIPLAAVVSSDPCSGVSLPPCVMASA